MAATGPSDVPLARRTGSKPTMSEALSMVTVPPGWTSLTGVVAAGPLTLVMPPIGLFVTAAPGAATPLRLAVVAVTFFDVAVVAPTAVVGVLAGALSGAEAVDTSVLVVVGSVTELLVGAAVLGFPPPPPHAAVVTAQT